jgi:hypothetical protein
MICNGGQPLQAAIGKKHVGQIAVGDARNTLCDMLNALR